MAKPGGSRCNLQTGRPADMISAREQVKFGYAKNETLPQYCRKCPFLTDCWGECPKNRIIRMVDGEPGLNYLCPRLKVFFAQAVPEVERIVADLKSKPVRPQKRM